jgi:hypothetical protein
LIVKINFGVPENKLNENFTIAGIIKSIVTEPDHFGKLDPNPHQSEKMEALEGHFGAFEGPNQEKCVVVSRSAST